MTNLLPEKLTTLRKKFQYAQADVAKKLNVSVSEYMNWENGNTICSIEQMKQLADLYHVPMEELMDNTRPVTLPDQDQIFESVEIPFQDIRKAEQEATLTDEVDIMPVEGVMPDANLVDENGNYIGPQNPAADSAGSDSAQDTREFAPTQMTPVEESTKQKSGGAAGGDDPEKKKKLIILGCVIAAAVLLVILLLTHGSSSSSASESTSPSINSLGTQNRLALGDEFALYIDDSGNLTSTGSAPDLSDFTDVVQVSAGADFALGLNKDGTVVCSGSTTACSVEDWTDVTMIAAGDSHSVGLLSDGTVVCTGSTDGCAVEDWTDVQAVYAGEDLTIGLKEDGTLLISGTVSSEDYLTALDSVSDLDIGSNEIAVVFDDGTVSCYSITSGSSTDDTTSWTSMKQAAVGDSFAAGLASGRVTVTDEDMDTTASSWTNIKYIAARGDTLVAVGSDGTIIGAGDNTYEVYSDTSSATASATATAGVQLDSVSNIQVTTTVNNLNITWTAVANAASYQVTVNTSPTTTLNSAKNSISIPVSKFTNGYTYTVTITAKASSSSSYEDSEPLSAEFTYTAVQQELDAVSNISATSTDDGWTITWSTVSNASSYTIELTADNTKILRYTSTTDSVAVPEGDLTDGATYTITITANPSDTAAYTASTATATKTYTAKTYEVVFNLSDGTTITVNLAAGTYKYGDVLNSKLNGRTLANPDATFEVTDNTVINGVQLVTPTSTPTATPTAATTTAAAEDTEEN